MEHVYTTQKPEIFEKIKEEAIRYRWDINPVSFYREEKEESGYMFEEVIVYSPISANKVFEKVITSLYPENYEHKLINEYNAAQLGLYEEPIAAECIQAYKDFLIKRNQLKTQVDQDCAKYNIV